MAIASTQGRQACLVRKADGAESSPRPKGWRRRRGNPARWRCSATTTSRIRRSATSAGCSTRSAIGAVNHVRIEMDEDFMADPEAPFSGTHEAAHGYGALDDFAVHPLSLVPCCSAASAASCATWPNPMPTRRPRRRAPRGRDLRHRQRADAAGKRRFGHVCWSTARPGAARAASPSRYSARKARSCYDQERLNEFQLYLTARPADRAGYPHHAGRRRITSPTTRSSRRPAMGSASTTSRSSNAGN